MGCKIFEADLKDYEIELDEGKCMITGDKIVGTFTGKDDPYFEGALFELSPSKKYNFTGSCSLTKEEFKEKVESWKEI